MPNLTPYQEQRQRGLVQIDFGLTDEMFPLLAHNWYLTGLHYGMRDPALLAKARRVKEVVDHYQSLQRLIWRGRERLVSLALRQVDGRYGAMDLPQIAFEER